ncbi:MAG: hypothetical protein JNK45_27670 [Myxococcales bacterium]|nr:hypothetical protein [Myxococcales bacterium]
MRCIGLNLRSVTIPLSVAVLLVACGDPAESNGTADSSSSSGSATATDPDSSGSSSSATLTDPDTSAGPTSGTDPSATESSGDSSGTGATSSGTESSSGDASSSTDPGESSSGGSALADITGDHLLALAVVIAPETPLQYLATVVQTPDGDGALLDISLQPLSLDIGSTSEPRLPFGDALVFDDIEVAPDGSFEIQIGALAVAGETNPITGSNVATSGVVLTGSIVDETSWCGTVTGMITMPLMLDLAGSTFAGTAIDGDLPLVVDGSC